MVAVLTRDNLNVSSPYYGAYIKDQPVVALEKVRYAGDIVAAVAAMDEKIAERAVHEIEVDYEELPGIFSVEDALSESAVIIHDENPARKDPKYGYGASLIRHDSSNIFYHFHYERGDVEGAFNDSDHVFEETYYLSSAQHYPLESHVSVADFQDDQVTIWSGSQTPFPLRQEIARMFGLPLSRVRVMVPYIGGGYGAKSGIKYEALAVALSRLAKRPVRLSLSADETFKTLCDPSAKVTIKTGVKKDGTFVARHCEVYLNGGAYANSGPTVTERAGYRAHGPYRIPHVKTELLLRLYEHRARRRFSRLWRAAGFVRLRISSRYDRASSEDRPAPAPAQKSSGQGRALHRRKYPHRLRSQERAQTIGGEYRMGKTRTGKK